MTLRDKLIAGLTGTMLCVGWAAAAPPPTLADLIADGSSGITLGYVRFYDFSYAPDANTPVTAAQIPVQTSFYPYVVSVSFGGNIFSADGNDFAATIGYRVHVLDTIPVQQNVISFALGTPGAITDAQHDDHSASVSTQATLTDPNGKALAQNKTFVNTDTYDMTLGGTRNVGGYMLLTAPAQDFAVSEAFALTSTAGDPNFAALGDLQNTFVVGPGLTADLNGDGKVDFADLLILSQNYGATDIPDLDGDRVVDFKDFLILAQEYGQQIVATEAASPSPVPEPSATAALALGLLCLRRSRRAAMA